MRTKDEQCVKGPNPLRKSEFEKLVRIGVCPYSRIGVCPQFLSGETAGPSGAPRSQRTARNRGGESRHCKAWSNQSMSTGVRFQQRKLGVICCGHVFRGERKVLLVGKLGGDWQFMVGGNDHFGSKDGHYVIVGVLLDSDPSLNEVADLPPGWEAERKGGWRCLDQDPV